MTNIVNQVVAEDERKAGHSNSDIENNMKDDEAGEE